MDTELIPIAIQDCKLSDSEVIGLLWNYQALRQQGNSRLETYDLLVQGMQCDSESQKFILGLCQFELMILEEEGKI